VGPVIIGVGSKVTGPYVGPVTAIADGCAVEQPEHLPYRHLTLAERHKLPDLLARLDAAVLAARGDDPPGVLDLREQEATVEISAYVGRRSPTRYG
jgi:hypothetical protein